MQKAGEPMRTLLASSVIITVAALGTSVLQLSSECLLLILAIPVGVTTYQTIMLCAPHEEAVNDQVTAQSPASQLRAYTGDTVRLESEQRRGSSSTR